MSKQSEAKERQGYQGKPPQKRCRVCAHLVATEHAKSWGGLGERLRCGLGGFAVTPNAVCNEFQKIED